MWLREEMKAVLVAEGNTATQLYSNMVQELGAVGLTSSDILFFVDELPTLKTELQGGFIRKKYLLEKQTLTAPKQQEALKDTDQTSLLYVTRLVCLTLVSNTQFALPMVGAGTDVSMAIQQEVLPSPFTRNNLVSFTSLVHVTVAHIVTCINTHVSQSIQKLRHLLNSFDYYDTLQRVIFSSLHGSGKVVLCGSRNFF